MKGEPAKRDRLQSEIKNNTDVTEKETKSIVQLEKTPVGVKLRRFPMKTRRWLKVPKVLVQPPVTTCCCSATLHPHRDGTRCLECCWGSSKELGSFEDEEKHLTFVVQSVFSTTHHRIPQSDHLGLQGGNKSRRLFKNGCLTAWKKLVYFINYHISYNIIYIFFKVCS